MGLRIEKIEETSLDKWYWFDDGFSSSELEKLENLLVNIDYQPGHLAGETGTLTEYRKSKIKWIPQELSESRWIYQKLLGLVAEANDALWKFELTDILDNLQYTVYESDGGHYDWHMDIGSGLYSRRKISITIQLSDSEEYEGGDLEFMIGREAEKAPRKKGTTVIFPSFFLHRVTPVVKGTRKSIVLWIAGTPFR